MNGQINRATQLWRNWEEKEKMLLEVFGHSPVSENLNKQRYEFLSAGIARFSRDTTPDEKLVLGLILKSTRRLEKELYPHPVVRLARRIRALVYDRPKAAARLKTLKAENTLALSQDLTALGFNTQKIALDKLLDYEQPKITVDLVSPYGTDHNFSARLQLEKDPAGHYQLQGYTATLKDPLNPEQSRSFTFDSNLGINAREAANLLQGRAVLKHHQIGANRMGSKWIQLDYNQLLPEGKPTLKEMGADYEFNIRQELVKVAQVLQKPELDSARVLDGMQQGCQVALKQVSGETHYLEADPLKKTITVRDAVQQATTLDSVVKKREKELTLKPEVKLVKTRTKQKNVGQAIGMA